MQLQVQQMELELQQQQVALQQQQLQQQQAALQQQQLQQQQQAAMMVAPPHPGMSNTMMVVTGGATGQAVQSTITTERWGEPGCWV